MKFKLKIKIDNPFSAKLVADDDRLIISLRSPKSMEKLVKVVPEFTEWARVFQNDNDSLLAAMLDWFGFRHSDFAVTSLDEMMEVGCISDDCDCSPSVVHPTGWIGIGPEVSDHLAPKVDGYRKLYAPSVDNLDNYFNHLVNGGRLVFYGVQNDRT